MGKYKIGVDEYTSHQTKWLVNIANELAEANRLKRLETMMILHDKPDGWYEDLQENFIFGFEDQA